MQDVEDKDHLSLLESALAEPIEEFKARVVREATAPPPPPRKLNGPTRTAG